ncbi:hypothetical protein ABB29_11995 [Pseudoxanthomonas dokdonensis]|uniref:Uncharacterized protein n=1 Tax=Pseudoxanthomonas dokdonensis TaxID=344882 RepID=A0A0R0CHC8_9GAMM|nr:hypothetical protein ABB29_11995 [Pseudoxanthomonas dokdonensis]
MSGGEAVAEEQTAPKPAPRSDAEAAQQEPPATDGEGGDEAAKAKEEADKKAADEQARSDRKKNRTREYIDRLNRENAELRRQVSESSQPRPATTTPQRSTPPADGEPTLDQFDFDIPAFSRAHAQWVVKQELSAREEQQKQTQATQRQQELQSSYNTRVEDFAEQTPDFYEVVGSIDPRYLPPQLQEAIIAHENGPQIAYHLGTNDDDLWAVASIRPELMADAVARLASRLTAAPPQVQSPPPAPVATPKPITRAPAPAPTVSGRAPTETPPEKLTDDEWFKRERERQRKR